MALAACRTSMKAPAPPPPGSMENEVIYEIDINEKENILATFNGIIYMHDSASKWKALLDDYVMIYIINHEGNDHSARFRMSVVSQKKTLLEYGISISTKVKIKDSFVRLHGGDMTIGARFITHDTAKKFQQQIVELVQELTPYAKVDKKKIDVIKQNSDTSNNSINDEQPPISPDTLTDISPASFQQEMVLLNIQVSPSEVVELKVAQQMCVEEVLSALAASKKIDQELHTLQYADVKGSEKLSKDVLVINFKTKNLSLVSLKDTKKGNEAKPKIEKKPNKKLGGFFSKSKAETRPLFSPEPRGDVRLNKNDPVWNAFLALANLHDAELSSPRIIAVVESFVQERGGYSYLRQVNDQKMSPQLADDLNVLAGQVHGLGNSPSPVLVCDDPKNDSKSSPQKTDILSPSLSTGSTTLERQKKKKKRAPAPPGAVMKKTTSVDGINEPAYAQAANIKPSTSMPMISTPGGKRRAPPKPSITPPITSDKPPPIFLPPPPPDEPPPEESPMTPIGPLSPSTIDYSNRVETMSSLNNDSDLQETSTEEVSIIANLDMILDEEETHDSVNGIVLLNCDDDRFKKNTQDEKEEDETNISEYLNNDNTKFEMPTPNIDDKAESADKQETQLIQSVDSNQYTASDTNKFQSGKSQEVFQYRENNDVQTESVTQKLKTVDYSQGKKEDLKKPEDSMKQISTEVNQDDTNVAIKVEQKSTPKANLPTVINENASSSAVVKLTNMTDPSYSSATTEVTTTQEKKNPLANDDVLKQVAELQKQVQISDNDRNTHQQQMLQHQLLQLQLQVIQQQQMLLAAGLQIPASNTVVQSQAYQQPQQNLSTLPNQQSNYQAPSTSLAQHDPPVVEKPAVIPENDTVPKVTPATRQDSKDVMRNRSNSQPLVPKKPPSGLYAKLKAKTGACTPAPIKPAERQMSVGSNAVLPSKDGPRTFSQEEFINESTQMLDPKQKNISSTSDQIETDKEVSPNNSTISRAEIKKSPPISYVRSASLSNPNSTVKSSVEPAIEVKKSISATSYVHSAAFVTNSTKPSDDVNLQIDEMLIHQEVPFPSPQIQTPIDDVLDNKENTCSPETLASLESDDSLEIQVVKNNETLMKNSDDTKVQPVIETPSKEVLKEFEHIDLNKEVTLQSEEEINSYNPNSIVIFPKETTMDQTSWLSEKPNNSISLSKKRMEKFVGDISKTDNSMERSYLKDDFNDTSVNVNTNNDESAKIILVNEKSDEVTPPVEQPLNEKSIAGSSNSQNQMTILANERKNLYNVPKISDKPVLVKEINNNCLPFKTRSNSFGKILNNPSKVTSDQLESKNHPVSKLSDVHKVIHSLNENKMKTTESVVPPVVKNNNENEHAKKVEVNKVAQEDLHGESFHHTVPPVKDTHENVHDKKVVEKNLPDESLRERMIRTIEAFGSPEDKLSPSSNNSAEKTPVIVSSTTRIDDYQRLTWKQPSPKIDAPTIPITGYPRPSDNYKALSQSISNNNNNEMRKSQTLPMQRTKTVPIRKEYIFQTSNTASSEGRKAPSIKPKPQKQNSIDEKLTWSNKPIYEDIGTRKTTPIGSIGALKLGYAQDRVDKEERNIRPSDMNRARQSSYTETSSITPSKFQFLKSQSVEESTEEHNVKPSELFGLSKTLPRQMKTDTKKNNNNIDLRATTLPHK